MHEGCMITWPDIEDESAFCGSGLAIWKPKPPSIPQGNSIQWARSLPAAEQAGRDLQL